VVRPNLTNCVPRIASARASPVASQPHNAHLLLLHELPVWAVVHDVMTKDGGGERSVNLLGVHILELAVQDEIIALCSEKDGGFLAQEDEGEDIPVLEEYTVSPSFLFQSPDESRFKVVGARTCSRQRKKNL